MYDFVQSKCIPSGVAAALGRFDVEVVGWCGREERRKRIGDVLPGVPYFSVPFPMSALPPQPADDIFSLTHAPTLLFLQERERLDATNMEDVLDIHRVHAHVVAVLDETRPEAILYGEVPHNIFSWILFVEARRRKIRQLFNKRGPLPHMFGAGEDPDNAILMALEAGRSLVDPAADLSEQSSRVLARMRRDYKAAAPPHMKKGRFDQLKKLADKPAKYVRDGRLLTSGAALLVRQLLRKTYESLAVPLDPTRPFVVYFLHLQPERSSVPEGGRYAQQWMAVERLSRFTPPDVQVYVREHPLTFAPGPKMVRRPSEYEAFLEIPKVQLLDFGCSPFEILDAALAVGTITGTVGFEAICRGTPAIVFGSSPSLTCEGVFDGRNDDELRTAVETVTSGWRVPSEGPEDFVRLLEASPLMLCVDDPRAVDDYMAFNTEGQMLEPLAELMLTALGATRR